MNQKKARKKSSLGAIERTCSISNRFLLSRCDKNLAELGLGCDIFSYQSSFDAKARVFIETTKFPCTKFKKTRLGHAEGRQKDDDDASGSWENFAFFSVSAVYRRAMAGGSVVCSQSFCSLLPQQTDTTILLRRDRKEGKLVFVNPTISASYPRVITS